MISGQDLAEIAKEFGRRISFSVSGDLEIRINIDNLAQERLLSLIQKILTKLLGLSQGRSVL
jgi:outer membrane receptor for monomeric catechols